MTAQATGATCRAAWAETSWRPTVAHSPVALLRHRVGFRVGGALQWSRPCGGVSKRSVEEMECQVALLREKVRYLQVLAMRPGQSSKDLERLRWLERAARIEVKRSGGFQRSRS